MKGLVLKGSNNIFYVECEDGKFRNCSIKGKILKDSALYYNPLAAGDFVNSRVPATDQACNSRQDHR